MPDVDAEKCAGAFGPSIVRSGGVGSRVSTIEADTVGALVGEGLEASWFVRVDERRLEKILGAANVERLNP